MSEEIKLHRFDCELVGGSRGSAQVVMKEASAGSWVKFPDAELIALALNDCRERLKRAEETLKPGAVIRLAAEVESYEMENKRLWKAFDHKNHVIENLRREIRALQEQIRFLRFKRTDAPLP